MFILNDYIINTETYMMDWKKNEAVLKTGSCAEHKLPAAESVIDENHGWVCPASWVIASCDWWKIGQATILGLATSVQLSATQLELLNLTWPSHQYLTQSHQKVPPATSMISELRGSC